MEPNRIHDERPELTCGPVRRQLSFKESVTHSDSQDATDAASIPSSSCSVKKPKVELAAHCDGSSDGGAARVEGQTTHDGAGK